MARYCGHCGQKGHNRRTCPHRSDEAKAQDKKWMRKSGRRKGSATKCSYCGTHGHNRRTCPHLALRKQVALKLVDSAVQRAMMLLSENGFGLGAMYEKANPWYRKEKNTYVVASHPLVVEYDERPYADNGEWSKGRVPMFDFSLYGQFLYGSNNNVHRQQAVTVRVYLDNLGREVTNSDSLRRFNDDDQTRWIGQSRSSYNCSTGKTLRESAINEVERFFKDKENRHPDFGWL